MFVQNFPNVDCVNLINHGFDCVCLYGFQKSSEDDALACKDVNECLLEKDVRQGRTTNAKVKIALTIVSASLLDK